MIQDNLSQIVSQFQFEGDFISVQPHGAGHINDTYKAWFQKNGSEHRYILQRINNKVFKNIEGLMQNMQIVTAHLREKITSSGGNPYRETLILIPTIDGKFFIKTEDNQYWRAFVFIERARTFEIVENLKHVYNAARAFGKFQKQLNDFPFELLIETIPDFHHTGKRFASFLEVVEADPQNRVVGSKPEIEFVLQRKNEVTVLIDLLKQGNLPARVTHNDTKFNNVMIDDETGEGICVIDLDTVMPGLSLYDFGDSIRSMANPAAEDERDLEKVVFNLEVFDCFGRGFLEITRDSLSSMEIELLPFSAKLMTFECGMRFLTDYLQGDTYYKIHRPDQNLDRCRTQFKLVKDMEERFSEMVRIIKNYL